MSAIKLVNELRERALAFERVLHEAQTELAALESVFAGEIATHNTEEIRLFYGLFPEPKLSKPDTVKLANLTLSEEWEVTPNPHEFHSWINAKRKFGAIEIDITIYTHD